ncbi:hypothetical protein MNBD_CHLOROFLEXI01-5397 [hydrothermal vent metagenome]|uniref:N-acetyltransferase domain-containing protein n=1 Tax=hydrothermal vent metagenome TaxID=652676 RepID=A0A3B0VA16_9ZZZZ
MKASTWGVRPPQLADVESLAAIATAVSASSRQTASTPITTSQISQTVQQTNGRFWTITQAEQPIGFANLLPIPGLPHLFELVGGIEPPFQRQGAGSFLWQHIKEAVAETVISTGSMQAVHQISHTVSDLNSPAAYFLQQHNFTLAHEEWTMVLDSYPTTSPPPADCLLQKIDRETAVRTLPALYQRCFAHTPWFQPYTPDEISSSWQANDSLYYLMENNVPIGFIWLHFSKNGQTEIEPIGIVPEKQGMGYGRFLLTTTLNKLPAKRRQTITLGVWRNNHKAIHLYQTVGFRHVSSSTILTFTVPPT